MSAKDNNPKRDADQKKRRQTCSDGYENRINETLESHYRVEV